MNTFILVQSRRDWSIYIYNIFLLTYILVKERGVRSIYWIGVGMVGRWEINWVKAGERVKRKKKGREGNGRD
jgi:hypothetical protein